MRFLLFLAAATPMLAILAGAWIIGVAVLDLDDAPFEPMRWVAALAGFSLFTSGLGIVAQSLAAETAHLAPHSLARRLAQGLPGYIGMVCFYSLVLTALAGLSLMIPEMPAPQGGLMVFLLFTFAASPPAFWIWKRRRSR